MSGQVPKVLAGRLKQQLAADSRQIVADQFAYLPVIPLKPFLYTFP